MKIRTTPLRLIVRLAVVTAIVLTGGCSADADSRDVAAEKGPVQLDVFKSPTCGCCEDWIAHLDDQSFAVTIHHPHDLGAQKSRHGIAPEHQSCHTGVTEEGFVFEGHIPAKFIHRYLAEPPAGTIGLAVPGMPVGSPGMEVGDRFHPYQVLLIHENGDTSVYAEVTSLASQHH